MEQMEQIIDVSTDLFKSKKLGEKIGTDVNKSQKYARAANELYSKTFDVLNTTNENFHEAELQMVEAFDELVKRKQKIMQGVVKNMATLMIKLEEKMEFDHDKQKIKELANNGFNKNFFQEIEKFSFELRENSDLKQAHIEEVSLPVIIFALVVTNFLDSCNVPGFSLTKLLKLYTAYKADEAEDEFHKAQQKFKEAKEYFENYSNQNALLRSITLRIKQICNLLKGLEFHFRCYVDKVQEIFIENGYNYQSCSEDNKNQILITLQIMKTVKAIIDLPILLQDTSGALKINYDPKFETGQRMLKILNSN